MTILTTLALSRIIEQKKAIKSWLTNGYSVFSINSKSDITKLSGIFQEVTFVETDQINTSFGKDYVKLSAFIEWIKENKEALIINSDIEIYGKVEVKTGLTMFSRNDYHNDLTTAKKFQSGFDAFFITQDFASKIPKSELVIGQCHWDYFIPMIAIRNKVPIYSPKYAPLYHKVHEVQYDGTKWRQTHAIFAKELNLTGNAVNDSSHSHALIKSNINYF